MGCCLWFCCYVFWQIKVYGTCCHERDSLLTIRMPYHRMRTVRADVCVVSAYVGHTQASRVCTQYYIRWTIAGLAVLRGSAGVRPSSRMMSSLGLAISLHSLKSKKAMSIGKMERVTEFSTQIKVLPAQRWIWMQRQKGCKKEDSPLDYVSRPFTRTHTSLMMMPCSE